MDFLNGHEVGERVVIVGGGLTGCEIAYELLLDEAARRGFELAEDSVEVTHIDAGFTSDETQYLTELQVPVKKSENTS